MSLWDDAAKQAQTTKDAAAEALAAQQAELREYVEAMGKLGIEPGQFLLFGWLSPLKDQPVQAVPNGEVIEGWAVATYSRSMLRDSDAAPFGTFHTVITTDGEVFETAGQPIHKTGIFGMKIAGDRRPLQLPIKDVASSAHQRVPLAQALRDALAKAISEKS